MPQMHSFRTRSSACVKVKIFSLLVKVQDDVHVSVGEEYASSEKMMRFLASDFLESS